MKIASVKPPEKRLEVNELASLLIKAYDIDNLYPQRLSQVIAASPAGSLCVRRAARFIEGKGLLDTKLYGYVVNVQGDTMDGVLKFVASDLARFGGFALHVNYNALCEIVNLTVVPFENCRLGFDDDNGYTGKIALHPDWSGKTKRRGKALKADVNTIDYIDVFNPLPVVVAAQIEAAQGIENYKGQVLYVSSAGRHTYPTPVADCMATDMSTDEGLGNIRYRNSRNNYLPSGMLVKPKGTEEEEKEFQDGFAQFQGDTKSNNIISVSVETDEATPTFIPFEGANFDDAFENTTKTITENIYAAFEQEKFYRIRSGSLGFSSDIATDVMNDYSDTLCSEQRMIERALTSIFTYWREYVSDNFSIIPLKETKQDGAPDKQE